ncbi:MAG: hypothetical protein ABR614_09050 [Mycobacteriales bacterium]
MAASGGAPRRDAWIVGFVLALGVLLTAGWFATGHASAPDSGLLQLDVLSLHERVPGVAAVDGKPTMVVLACSGRSELPPAYGVVVHRPSEPVFAGLAEALALPRAVDCSAGYALVDPAGFVRYRSYDAGWAGHTDEQSILLDAL